MMNELFERTLKITPGGVHSPVRSFKGLTETPIFVASSNNAKMQATDGK